jgi:predicted nucleic acid-binding protein
LKSSGDIVGREGAKGKPPGCALTDWAQTGKALARLAVKYDYERIGQGRLTNDALIAASAGRMGITVITESAGDFVRLAEFLPFQWREATGFKRQP